MTRPTLPGPRSAFTLVELAVVLTIVAMITGAILGGQSLLRAAQVKSVTTDYERYEGAVKNFRDRFKSLPGDMVNATAIWGSLAGCPTATATVGQSGTCNGDGDGTLMYSGVANPKELGRFWQHLSNANLIEGFYAGYGPTTTGSGATPGTNVPMSKIPNGYFLARPGMGYLSAGGTTINGGTTTTFAGDYGYGMFVFSKTGEAVNLTNSGPLTPTEAYNIDDKMDDALPAGGRIMAIKGNGTKTNCTTNAGVAPPGDAGSTYLISNHATDCVLFFVRAF